MLSFGQASVCLPDCAAFKHDELVSVYQPRISPKEESRDKVSKVTEVRSRA